MLSLKVEDAELIKRLLARGKIQEEQMIKMKV